LARKALAHHDTSLPTWYKPHAVHRAEFLMQQGYVPIRQPDIDLHHVERRVTKDLLKAERVAAVQDVLGREGVAQGVRRDADALDAGLLPDAAELLAE
jgi:hypothetical protein